jgi:uncharacterized membrane protein
MSQTGSKPLGPEDSGDPEAKWWWRLGHASPWLFCLAWVALTVSFVFDWQIIGTFVVLTFPVVMMTYVKHEFQPLCIRCLREQPENGGQVAQRKLIYLWTFHLPPFGPLGRIAAVFVTIVLWVAGSFMRDSALGILMGAVGGSLITVDWYLLYLHRKLKPWCPWCKDPGDDPDPVPEHDPDPGVTKRS